MRGYLIGAAVVVFIVAMVWGDARYWRRHHRNHARWVQLRLEGDPSDQRAFLRHPALKPRCSCGKYGLPFNVARVGDDTHDHTEGSCFPAIESLEPR